MSSDDTNERKRKPSDSVSSADDDPNRQEEGNKFRKVSTDASASTSASLQVDTPVATERATTANTASAAATEYEESISSIGKIIQDLFRSDNPKVNATLDTLFLDLDKNEEKCENLVTAGGCFALVQLLNKYLDKAIARIPA
jgi:hypothetical protein